MAKLVGRRSSIWLFRSPSSSSAVATSKRLKVMTSEEIPLTSISGGGSGRTTSEDTTDDESSPHHRAAVTSQPSQQPGFTKRLQYDTASSSYGGSPQTRSASVHDCTTTPAA